MLAAIITIGDEILIGETVDTNSAWIGQELNKIGIDVRQIKSVSDKEEELIQALDEAKLAADVILITGGLGPTNDDITKKTLAKYFDTKLVFRPEFFENVKRIFESRNLPILEKNKQQAELPENCIGLHNTRGTAPGMWFEQQTKIFISMPGVPFEMKMMMENEVLPRIKSKYILPYIIHKHILICGIGESFLAEKIKDWEDALSPHIKLAYLPSVGKVKLRLTARGNDQEKLQSEIDSLVEKLIPLVDRFVYGFDEESLEGNLGKILKTKKMIVTTAESCTAGFIASQIASVPGSSAYYNGSAVAYSYEAKEDLLRVKKETLEKFGAVSEETVREMMNGVLKLMRADVGIAVSGIAGPDGGTADKPVGTVWIAVGGKNQINAKRFYFPVNNRSQIIQLTATTALNRLRLFLLGNQLDS